MSNRRLRNVSELTAGQAVRHWHDTGCFGVQPVYSRVECVTAKTVVLVDEFGNRARKTNATIHLFETCRPGEWEEIMAEKAARKI